MTTRELLVPGTRLDSWSIPRRVGEIAFHSPPHIDFLLLPSSSFRLLIRVLFSPVFISSSMMQSVGETRKEMRERKESFSSSSSRQQIRE